MSAITKHRHSAVVLIGLCMIAGCSSPAMLMPTPNLYAWGNFDPFDKVPAEWQNNRVEVLYYTDRVPTTQSADSTKYGFKRSRSAAFGIAELQIGARDLSWEKLLKASRTKVRLVPLPLTIASVREMGRFQPTPPRLVPTATTQAAEVNSVDEQAATEAAFKKELSARLALTPCKEVYIFIHGFANTFDDAIATTGEMWHFFGRRGVPIAYSWPAGSTGLLAYMYDRESSEFTVYHLKQMLRLIASCPDVEQVNIIAHSRGTDVAVTALRELHLEIHGGGRDTRDVLRLRSLVLAAPDLDFDVVIQRVATERLGQVADQTVIYVCSKDRALGMADWLFNSVTRLGQLESKQFSPEELEAIRHTHGAQIIDARISDPGAFGHSYFQSDAAVSSDLILMMRYHLAPGAENGRPLRVTKNGFWTIDDDYPGPERSAQAGAAGETP